MTLVLCPSHLRPPFPPCPPWRLIRPHALVTSVAHTLSCSHSLAHLLHAFSPPIAITQPPSTDWPGHSREASPPQAARAGPPRPQKQVSRSALRFCQKSRIRVHSAPSLSSTMVPFRKVQYIPYALLQGSISGSSASSFATLQYSRAEVLLVDLTSPTEQG